MGSFLDKPVTAKTYARDVRPWVECVAVSMQGWRKSQEDDEVVEPELDEHTSFYAVFDGHGGGEVSKFASRHATKTLRSLPEFKAKDYPKALVRLYHRIDEMLVDPKYARELADRESVTREEATSSGDEEDDVTKSSNRPMSDEDDEGAAARPTDRKRDLQEKISAKMAAGTEKGALSSTEAQEVLSMMLDLKKIGEAATRPFSTSAGATAVSALVDRTNQILYVANAGDSRCVLCRANGVAEPMSYDHKPLNPEELRRINAAGSSVTPAGRVNGVLNLSRALGDLSFKQNLAIPPAEQAITAEPDLKQIGLLPDDEFIILACDGIWDCLTNQECVDRVRTGLLDTNGDVQLVIEQILDSIIADTPTADMGKGADNMTLMVAILRK